MVETGSLPTPVALAARRVNVAGVADGATSFLQISYLAECGIKLMGAAAYAAVKESAPSDAYRIGHGFIRDTGLGTWDQALATVFSRPLVDSLPVEARSFLRWATKRRKPQDDPWFVRAKQAGREVLDPVGLSGEAPDPGNARGLLSLLVYIRNKTKAHGALGIDFFDAANPPYLELVTAVLTTCPLFSWDWFTVRHRADQERRLTRLRGAEPIVVKGLAGVNTDELPPGVFVYPGEGVKAFGISDLVAHDSECRTFLFPNGGADDSAGTLSAEFIDYGTGQLSKKQVTLFERSPEPLRESETHGLKELEIQTNAFENLPRMPDGYVHREELEAELLRLLVDSPYHFITLHGRGGVGKTRLALCIAHALASKDDTPFEHIVWFSARDVDLTAAGPIPVRPAISDLEAAAKAYGRLFEVEGDLDTFRAALGTASGSRGTLFIFDNFETVEDKIGVQRFLADHTDRPNRVLITTRERAFKGDYPVEVSGMGRSEAVQLLQGLGRTLGVEKLFDNSLIDDIYSFSEGHAYVMRLLAGEVAVTGRRIGAKQIVGRSDHILDAVFQRSYEQLSEAGRNVYLAVGNWQSEIAELALLAVIGKRDVDVMAGLDECVRLALIERGELADHEPCYWAPQLARSFAERKLRGAPDALEIRSDLAELRAFRVIPIGSKRPDQQQLIDGFARHCLANARSGSPDTVHQLDATLERVGMHWPEAWLTLAEFRSRARFSADEVLEATQRAVEYLPGSRQAWSARRDQARRLGNDDVAIAAEIELADLDPDDTKQLEQAAVRLLGYLTEHKGEIPVSRRQSYVRVVRDHMVQRAQSLTPTALSLLGWLFLVEGDEEGAWEYAARGLRKNRDHSDCRKLIQTLFDSGYRPKDEFKDAVAVVVDSK